MRVSQELETRATSEDPTSRLSIARIEALDEGAFRRVLLGVFGLLVVVYVLAQPGNRNESDDAYQFALDIEEATGSARFNPRHMLFVPIMQGIFRFASGIGLVDRSLGVITVTGALLSAAALVLLVLILHRRLGLSRSASLAGGAILGVMYGWWRFAAEVEVYALGLFVANLLLYLGLSSTKRIAWWIAVGVFAPFAFLVHGVNGILGFVAIPVFLAVSRMRRQFVVYLAVAVPLLIIGTYGFYLVGEDGNQGYREYYSSDSEITFDPGLVARGAIGAGQSVLAGNFLFAYDGFADRISDAIPERSIDDEVYLGDRMNGVVRGFASLTFLFAVVAFLATVALALPGIVRTWRSPPVLTVLALFLLLTAFQLVRRIGADGPEVWRFVLPPLAILLIVGLEATPGRTTFFGVSVILLLVAGLFAHNSIGAAVQQGTGGDRNAAKSAWIVDNANADDVVLTSDSALFSRYARYHADADVIYLFEESRQESSLNAALDEALAAKGDVYASADVFDVPDYIRSLDGQRYERLVAFGDEMRRRFERVSSDTFGGVFVLTD